MQLNPVSQNERLESLDLLRGFALLGILAMNIRGMAGPLSSYMNPQVLFDYEGVSRAAFVFTAITFDLKMMGLFSMLFGAGVILYAAKPTAGGAAPRGLWFRRMFWLLVIGLVHAYLIWDGDILVPYALCGLIVLWWVRNWSARTLMTASMVFLTIGALLSVSFGSVFESWPETDRAEILQMWMPTPAQAQQQVAVLLGSYTDVVVHRAPFVFMAQSIYFFMFFLWRCGGMMLLGMALYKWGFLEGRLPAAAYAKTAMVCLPIGLLLAGVGIFALERIAFAFPARTTPDTWNYVGAISASVGYAAALLLIMKHGMLTGIRRRLAAVGQMALTNYLTHSIVTSVLFLGWGGGLAGQFDYARQLLVVVAIWSVQLIVSPVWMARYRFGPAEWLWRSLTYWERQPMRRDTFGPTQVRGVHA